MFSIRCGMNQTKLKPCTAYCNPVDAHRFLTMKYWVPGTQDYMTKSKISSHPKAKIGCLWHPGTLKHSPVDVNWSLKNSNHPSYLFVLGEVRFLVTQRQKIGYLWHPKAQPWWRQLITKKFILSILLVPPRPRERAADSSWSSHDHPHVWTSGNLDE